MIHKGGTILTYVRLNNISEHEPHATNYGKKYRVIGNDGDMHPETIVYHLVDLQTGKKMHLFGYKLEAILSIESEAEEL